MKYSFAAVLLACSASASAGVVYNWQTSDALGATSAIGGQLVIDDAAWRSGAVHYQFSPTPCTYMPSTCLPDEPRGDPLSAVIQLAFHIRDQAGGWTWHQFREGLGFQDGQSSYLDLQFGPRGELSGAIGSGGTWASMDMTGSGGLWALDRLYTDRDGGSCWFDVCPGVTGTWVLDESTVPVPAPGSLPAAMAALGALALLQRRQTRPRGKA